MRREEDYLDHSTRISCNENRRARRWAVKTLSGMLGIRRGLIHFYLDRPCEQRYVRCLQAKAHGVREILVPKYLVFRLIQHRLREKLIAPIHDTHVHGHVHGYVKGRSIFSCAAAHLAAGSTALLSLDLRDAYVSVDAQWLKHCFLTGYPESKINLWGKLPDIILDLLMYNGPSIYRRGDEWNVPPLSPSLVRHGVDYRLPQGALTSPTLFNLACGQLDLLLDSWAKGFGVVVTRYADNIFISSDHPIPWRVRARFMRVVTNRGFRLRSKKTQYQEATYGRPLTMLGLVLGENGLRLSHARRQKMRIHLFNALKAGKTDRAQGILNYVRQFGEEIPRQLETVLARFPAPDLFAPPLDE